MAIKNLIIGIILALSFVFVIGCAVTTITPTLTADQVVCNADGVLDATEQCDAPSEVEADEQCQDVQEGSICSRDDCICYVPSEACNANGQADVGEECDPVQINDPSKCNPDCTWTFCGDGEINVPNGKSLGGAPPGYIEECDPGPNGTNQTGADLLCQALTGDPGASCRGCRCAVPPFPCSLGTFLSLLGVVGPLPAGAVCSDDCAALDPSWTCDMVNCVCNAPQYGCVANTLKSMFGRNTFDPWSHVCNDDCAVLQQFLPAGSLVACDMDDCVCKAQLPPGGAGYDCAGNTFASAFGGNTYQAGQVCDDNCDELGELFGMDLECDLTSCVCLPEDEEEEEEGGVSCAENRDRVLVQGRAPIPTDADNVCIDDCEEELYCNEHCVCDYERVVTPRCGDGYISSQWVGGGGHEECDLGGRYNASQTKPDTCPEPEVCVECRCVNITEEPTDLVDDDDDNETTGCVEPYMSYDFCAVNCTSGECRDKVRLSSGEQCYECVEYECEEGTWDDEDDCEENCQGGTCYETNEYLFKECYGCEMPLDCDDYCEEQDMTATEPDWSDYILGYLNQNGVCRASATISYGSTLTHEDCTCYPTSEPSIDISSSMLSCDTDCGTVECGSETSCSCGDQCTLYVSCNWAGWKFEDDQYIAEAGVEEQQE